MFTIQVLEIHGKLPNATLGRTGYLGIRGTRPILTDRKAWAIEFPTKEAAIDHINAIDGIPSHPFHGWLAVPVCEHHRTDLIHAVRQSLPKPVTIED